MLYDIITTTILSILIIVCLHYIYEFFKTNLTTPKINDLITRPTQTYQEINDILSSEPIPLLPTLPVENEMKHELKNYLKTLSSK